MWGWRSNTPSEWPLVVDRPKRSPGLLCLPSPAFRFQTAHPRSCGWLGRAARPWPLNRLAQQPHQPLNRILAIRSLGTKASGLDAQHAISPDSSARQTPQPCANILRQGGAGEDIESQADSRGYLVDVLPARPGGANEVEMNLAFVNGEIWGDLDHFSGSLGRRSLPSCSLGEWGGTPCPDSSRPFNRKEGVFVVLAGAARTGGPPLQHSLICPSGTMQ